MTETRGTDTNGGRRGGNGGVGQPPPETGRVLPDLTELAVPQGARTVVVGDPHLPTFATETSRTVESDRSAVSGQWTGPGVFVVAGDGFELRAGSPDVGCILDAHPRFARAPLRACTTTAEPLLAGLTSAHRA